MREERGGGERESCLILGGSKVLSPLPALKKNLGCANFTNFKRKESVPELEFSVTK